MTQSHSTPCADKITSGSESVKRGPTAPQVQTTNHGDRNQQQQQLTFGHAQHKKPSESASLILLRLLVHQYGHNVNHRSLLVLHLAPNSRSQTWLLLYIAYFTEEDKITRLTTPMMFLIDHDQTPHCHCYRHSQLAHSFPTTNIPIRRGTNACPTPIEDRQDKG